jgi:hypothetical protein
VTTHGPAHVCFTPQKRTLAVQLGMSALGQKRTCSWTDILERLKLPKQIVPVSR